MTKFAKKIALIGAYLLTGGHFIYSMESTGRYFPFSYRFEKACHKKGSTIDIDAFYISGQNISNDDSTPIGMGEVAGSYDLSDLVAAMDQSNIQTTSIKLLIGDQYKNRPMRFDVQGKTHSSGLVFRYAYGFSGPFPITLGTSLPVINLESELHYSLNQRNFIYQYQLTTPQIIAGIPAGIDDITWNTYQEKIDHARRIAHESTGLSLNHSKQIGIGDLDLFARINFVLDHRFLMRNIDFAIQYGVVAPTGFQRITNEPSSISATNNGHWSMYAQFSPIFELKQDLKIGFILRGQHFFSQTREQRLPIFKESYFYSPLTAKTRIAPGSTFLAGAFLGLENLYDGMHLQGKYSYKRHNADKWSDERENKTIPSYLSRTPTPNITQNEINNTISEKEYLSKYRSHYITIQLTYDPLEAGQVLPLRPKYYIAFEMPVFDSSRGTMEAKQITFGAELHF